MDQYSSVLSAGAAFDRHPNALILVKDPILGDIYKTPPTFTPQVFPLNIKRHFELMDDPSEFEVSDKEFMAFTVPVDEYGNTRMDPATGDMNEERIRARIQQRKHAEYVSKNWCTIRC